MHNTRMYNLTCDFILDYLHKRIKNGKPFQQL